MINDKDSEIKSYNAKNGKMGIIGWPNKALYRLSDLSPKRWKNRMYVKCVGQTRPYT